MLQFNHDKELNYVLKLDKKIINIEINLKNKEEITEVDYNHLYPFGTCLSILYGLAKMYKPLADRWLLFHPFFQQ